MQYFFFNNPLSKSAYIILKNCNIGLKQYIHIFSSFLMYTAYISTFPVIRHFICFISPLRPHRLSVLIRHFKKCALFLPPLFQRAFISSSPLTCTSRRLRLYGSSKKTSLVREKSTVDEYFTHLPIFISFFVLGLSFLNKISISNNIHYVK